MLYRIQTFYLFLSILISSISLYLYVYYQQKEIKNSFFIDKIFLIFLIITFILSIISLLFFKKKEIQIFCNCLNILINSATLIYIIFFSYYYKYFLIKKNIIILILSTILFLYLSNKKIKKDIELIRSMNRIR
ncbi:DUF4293 family protein [Blattabacterium punctulatus]|uniref:DUF4293 domain-containing protein n=1 Tax=Blattabacterium punctulatus TaxID=164514 RepID=A0ABN5M5X4_9FLAO|nr:DUF4293 family protein [Blattabacterium punctulatus]AWU40008.1 hypothetical protein DM808_02485 [Blattabacterium punctulatus]AWU40551.1 hypothetical protein DM805_02490 [Blattabacterium punctulatus]AWU42805.1 hypothetical protein DM811_02490 [Blattabacterium punctulatus]AWU43352.1 hypothetical protein DM809_02485 [Blattabacterium punctulatus]AWU45006.1 hypothetical protein DM803_02500 [Blattabacterium punctulatus]